MGRIRRISLDPGNPERVRLVLEIEQGTPVKQDTVATLEVRGLTGLAYVNLVGGSRQAPPLTAPEGTIPVIPSRPSLWGRLNQKLGLVLENLIDASRELKEWLSEENRKLLFRTLEHLEALSGLTLRQSENVETAIGDLAGTLRNTRQASEGLPELVERLQKGADAIERMANTFEHTGSTLGRAVTARDRTNRAVQPGGAGRHTGADRPASGHAPPLPAPGLCGQCVSRRTRHPYRSDRGKQWKSPGGNRTFTYQDACDRASPEGGVSTANRLVGRFLGELRGVLRQLLGK